MSPPSSPAALAATAADARHGPPLAFTVAVVTLDRAAYLPRTLDAVLEQLLPHPDARLLVIDNGSVDATPAILARYAEQHRQVRTMVEPRRGAYYARSRAIEEASGDCLILVDDDARLNPGVIDHFLLQLRRDPRIGVIGCAVVPDWETRPAPRLHRKLRDALVLVDPADRAEILSFPCLLPAICLALRLNACADAYASGERRRDYPIGRSYRRVEFDDALILGGEDTDLCEIYARSGFKVVLDRRVSVAHVIPTRRLAQPWFERKFAGDGVVRIRLMRLTGRPMLSRHTLPMLAALPLLWLLHQFYRLLPRRLLLVHLYFLKSQAAWRELLHGARVAPLPYRILTDPAAR